MFLSQKGFFIRSCSSGEKTIRGQFQFGKRIIGEKNNKNKISPNVVGLQRMCFYPSSHFRLNVWTPFTAVCLRKKRTVKKNCVKMKYILMLEFAEFFLRFRLFMLNDFSMIKSSSPLDLEIFPSDTFNSFSLFRRFVLMFGFYFYVRKMLRNTWRDFKSQPWQTFFLQIFQIISVQM